MNEARDASMIARRAAEVIAAYLAHNTVRAGDLPGIISSVHAALAALGKLSEQMPVKREPAVPVRRSVTPDHIVSLEDGRHYKSLKRHLTTLGLTPGEYRRKWGLPADYPMVARNYAKQRSDLAKSIGLGRKARPPEPVQEASPAATDGAVPTVDAERRRATPAQSGRGRKKAA